MITIYVIRSLNKNYRYVGMTDDLNRRLKEHEKGKTISTRSYAPFKLILSENYEDRTLARVREKFLKSGAGRKFLDTLESS